MSESRTVDRNAGTDVLTLMLWWTKRSLVRLPNYGAFRGASSLDSGWDAVARAARSVDVRVVFLRFPCEESGRCTSELSSVVVIVSFTGASARAVRGLERLAKEIKSLRPPGTCRRNPTNTLDSE